MPKMHCRLCGSWIVYDNPNDGDAAFVQHREACHSVRGILRLPSGVELPAIQHPDGRIETGPHIRDDL